MYPLMQHWMSSFKDAVPLVSAIHQDMSRFPVDDFEQRFRHYLGQAKLTRKLRIKQWFFNARMFYLLPIMLSMTIANFVAHALFNGKQHPAEWMAVAFGLTFVLSPLLFRFMRKDKAFDSERYYMLDALQKTLEKDKSHGGI